MSNPPAEYRFKEGESGNPNGRPKGSKNTRTILRELLELSRTVTHNDGTEHQATNHEIICGHLIKMALDGDLSAIDRVFDRVEGKPTQPLSGDAEKPPVSVVQATPEQLAEAMVLFKSNLTKDPKGE